MDKMKKSVLAPGLVALIFILLKVSVHINQDIFTSGESAYLALILLQLMIFLFPAILYCKLHSDNFSDHLKIRLLTPDKIPITVLAALILLFGTAIIKLLLSYFGVVQESYSLYSYSVPSGDSGFLKGLYVLTVFAVIPAVTEEFVFRGIVQAEYEDCGIWMSILMPSMLFAMLHFSIRGLPVYLFGGIVLGFTAYITRSLLSTVIIHIINNIFSIFIEGYIWDVFAKPENIIFLVFILLALFLLFLILFLSEAERIIYNMGLSNEPSPKGPRSVALWFSEFGRMLISPTFLVCFLIFILSVCRVI